MRIRSESERGNVLFTNGGALLAKASILVHRTFQVK